MITVKTTDLQKALKHVLSTRSKSVDTVISNVYLKILDNNLMEFVSTDGNVLSLDRIIFEGDAGLFMTGGYIIQNFEQLAKILDKKIKTTCFNIIDNKIIVSQYENNFTLVTCDNLQYPQYEQLIQNYNTQYLDKINYTDAQNVIKIAFNRKILETILKSMESTTSEIITMGITHNNNTTLQALYINNQTYNDALQFNLLMPIQLR